jgi:nucleoside-diphosphate-sugar epimerase
MERQRPLKVAITGATGFIGRNLAERLREDGAEVLATGRNAEIGRILESRGVAFHVADIASADQVLGSLATVDCLIHCAAKTGDWGTFEAFHEAKVLGTRHVIRACGHHAIRRVIFISTPSIYFDGRDRLGIRESEPLPERQRTNYASTKLAAEQELLANAGANLDVIILRPRAVFGAHDATFLPRVKRMAQRGRFPLLGGGKALVDVTYIENLVDAVRACLVAPRDAWNDVYNVTNGDPITMRRWLELMLGVAGQPFRPKNEPMSLALVLAGAMELASRLPFGPREPSMTRFSVAYMACSMTLSIEKARERLRYSPRFDTAQSFDHYRQNERAAPS